MLGDTLVFTLGGTGGTARTLNKINQDGYASEYLYRSSTDEIRARVRHTRESVRAGKPVMERHNVELTQTVFATPVAPEFVRQTYVVFRNQIGDDLALNTDVSEALVYFLTGANLLKLAGWES